MKPSEPQTEAITVRMSKPARTVLEARAQHAGYTELGPYIRASLLAMHVPVERKVPAVNYATWGSLGKLASNLNQLLVYLHKGEVIDPEQGEQLATVLETLRREIGDVRVLLLGGTAEDLG